LIVKALCTCSAVCSAACFEIRESETEKEPLALYVQFVRDAALIFPINETESQVVGRIVEGLTPTQRARFVFQAPPNNFQQLEQLVVLDRNITYADKTRETPAAIVRVNAVETNATTSATRQF
jgi:hypothetical protein